MSILDELQEMLHSKFCTNVVLEELADGSCHAAYTDDEDQTHDAYFNDLEEGREWLISEGVPRIMFEEHGWEEPAAEVRFPTMERLAAMDDRPELPDDEAAQTDGDETTDTPEDAYTSDDEPDEIDFDWDEDPDCSEPEDPEQKGHGDAALKDYLKLSSFELSVHLKKLSDKELVYLSWAADALWQEIMKQEAMPPEYADASKLNSAITAEESDRFERRVLKAHKKFKKKLKRKRRHSFGLESED